MRKINNPKKLLTILFIIGLLSIIFGISGLFLKNSNENNHGVYSDVPDTIAKEVEHTTFVRPLEPLEPPKGIDGFFNEFSGRLGISENVFKMVISLIFLLSIMSFVSMYASSWGATIGIGLITGVFLMIIGLLPWWIPLIFAFVFLTYIIIDILPERMT